MAFNLRAVDLNLLPVFEAAYEERSLSRAAARLALTQSAVSHALARLRATFRDELFVRRSRGIEPTPTADRVYARLAGALGSVRDAVVDARAFDPATSERQFSVSIQHPLGPMMAVRLRDRLARVAPRVTVAFSTRSRPIEQERGLREGRFDAAVDWLLPAGGEFRNAVLLDDGVVFMVRGDHPVLRQRSQSQVLRSTEFVLLRKRVEGEHPVPALRELQRLPIRVAFEVSEFIEVLMVAVGSDLVAPVPLSMERMTRRRLGLRPVPALPRLGPIAVELIWHRGRERDPGNTFLRAELAKALREAVLDR